MPTLCKKCIWTRVCPPIQLCSSFFATEAIANLSGVLREHCTGCCLLPALLTALLLAIRCATLFAQEIRPNPRWLMTRSPLRCCTSIIQSSALVQASSSLSIGRTCAWPWRLPVTEMNFRHFSREFFYTQGWPFAKGILPQPKSLPPTATPDTLQGTTPPSRQVPDKTHAHMHPSLSPRVLDSDHWHHTPGQPSAKGILSQFKSLPPTDTPATLHGTTSSQESGTRQDPCSHAPELIPSSSRLRSLASCPVLALCQRNPLPIQIPPTYSHS